MGHVIGLLGGVAAGKSTVAACLARAGWLVLDADRLAREVVARPDVLAALEQRFGPTIRGPDGALDRPALAALAFADPGATADLNALVHPAVRAELEARLEAAGARPVVLDVPLLLESPLAGRVHTWVFVESPEAAREARARDRDWSPGERARREALQASLAAKRARADVVLENSGTIDDLERQVTALLERLPTSDPPSA